MPYHFSRSCEGVLANTFLLSDITDCHVCCESTWDFTVVLLAGNGLNAQSHAWLQHLSLHNEEFYVFLLQKIAYLQLKLYVQLFTFQKQGQKGYSYLP